MGALHNRCLRKSVARALEDGRLKDIEIDAAAHLLPSLFDRAVAEETARLGGGGERDRIKSLRRQLKKVERERDRLMKAIIEGAGFASIQGAFTAREAEIAALKTEFAEAEQAIAERSTPPSDPARAYARSVARLEEHRGDPDLVHQAHEHLAILMERIVLTPDDIAADGIAAEIHTDLSRFLCAEADGGPEAPRRRFCAIGGQLTVILRPMARHGSSLRRGGTIASAPRFATA